MVCALVMLVGGTGNLTDCASVLLSLKLPSGCHIHQRTGASPSRGPPGPRLGPGKPLVTVCRSAAIEVSHLDSVPSTLEVRLWDTISTTATAIRTYRAATIPVAGGGDRVDPSSLIKALRNGRELAGILLGLPRGALTRLVRRVFVRHERSRAGAR